ncbi:hypothetical protein JJB09_21755 [Rhizobium sp. KVB221]|uniref:Uncharacterized protein n=1 Tax=Rhizobium setariae TaxID=2801340 RepID=A0A936YTI6_9HYPH|nr:hypothetical protein [Rhizobium setariae]MBL0374642.1 hypothetical protein [Rhizobium setariae]
MYGLALAVAGPALVEVTGAVEAAAKATGALGAIAWGLEACEKWLNEFFADTTFKVES